jgi:hypothetical protein
MSHTDPGPRGELPIDEATIENQCRLPLASIDVAPPVGGVRSVDCPGCGRDVSDSRRSYSVPVDLVDDEPGLEARPIEKVPIFGWHCEYCDIVLPLDVDLAHREPSIAPPSEGWLVVSITPERGPSIDAFAPNREVIGR